MKVIDRINNQIQRQGLTDNNKIVLKLYTSCLKNKFNSQDLFFSFIRVEHEKYGDYSYQYHHNYYVKDSFQDFISDMYNVLVWGE